MKIITVSGAASGVGKTALAEILLKNLRGWSAIKVTVLHKGACPLNRDCEACEKIDSKFSILSDRRIIEKKGKDTQRLKQAGAVDVFWLRAKPEGLKEGLAKLISRLKARRGLIIEGTSVLKYLNPDVAIFLMKKNSILKDSAKEVLKKIDLMLVL
ncbi:MAG: hypothetical protein AB1629_05685 [Candidatus Omnitrophota bacterium]